jgi:DNA primase
MSGAFPLFAEIAATVAVMGVAVTGWTIWMWWQDGA